MAAQMNAYVAGVEAIIGYHFTSPNQLWEALQAAGSPVRSIGARQIPDGNKRQAIIGDSVLKLALISRWYNGTDPRGKDLHLPRVGQSTYALPEAIQDIVSFVGANANLDTVGRTHGLDRFVVTNPASRGAVSHGTMATTVEAILGAAYLDGGMVAVIQTMRTLGLGPV